MGGEAANKYGPLAEMQTLGDLLKTVIKEYTLIQGNFSEMQGSAAERAKKNAQLRARLENVRKDVSQQMNALFGKMMNMNPEDLLSEEEINKHLADAFHKFDEDNSGQLGQWEFMQAWFFLGLKGTEEEITDAFKGVDTNNSGLVDINEFKDAIRGERMLESNLMNVLEKMGVGVGNTEDRFKSFKATEKRR